MKTRHRLPAPWALGVLAAVAVLCACSTGAGGPVEAPAADPGDATETDAMSDAEHEVVKTDEEWRKILTPEQFQVTRREGTERAFTGKYWDTKTPGTYRCVCCGGELFRSDTKFDSGSGWPSFWQPSDEGRVTLKQDRSLGMVRTEVECRRCGAHLGHVFEDGPEPTGLRYCINSASLELEKE